MKTFDGYKKRALTDEYALLAGGGHKPLSDFSMAHTHPYLPLAGGTMTGALNFKNGTWNLMGDDAYIGDCNVAGMIGVKGANAATPGFALYNNSGKLLGKLYASEGTLNWSGGTIQATTFNGNAATASKLGTSTIGATNIPIYLNGGTPKAVDLNSTANNLINNLSTGNSVPVDNDYYIAQYVNGGTTKMQYYRKPHFLLYNYIKNKAEGTWDISISGNADTIDNKHASDFVPRYIGTGSVVFTQNNFCEWNGALITTPFTWSNPNTSIMFAFTIRIYEGYTYTDIVISGYCYGTNHWHAPKCHIIGGNTAYNVKFGWFDTADAAGAKHLYVWFGKGKSINNIIKFGYGGFSIMNVHAGHNKIDVYSGWSASNTSLDELVNIQSEQIPDFGKADIANKLITARTLTIGNTGKSFNGSSNVSWSLSEIGAASSGHTHSVKINGTTKTIAASGGAAVDLGNYKTPQTTVSDPAASGTSISFIDTISLNTNGVIAATKKTVPTMGGATTSIAGTAGLVPAPAANLHTLFLKGDGTWATPSDTHWTTHLYIGTKDTANNAATTNGNTYIKITDNSTIRNQYIIKGAGRTTVASDTSGNITIISPIVTWSEISDKPNTFSPSEHNHPTSQINALTNYTKATAAAALATTDSLNAALGKLEYKLDIAYDLVTKANDSDGTIENLKEILDVLAGIKDTETIKAIIGKYLPLTGGTLTGNLWFGAGNTDKYITFTSATTGTDTNHSWRIGYIGSGSDDRKHFVLQSTKTTTNTWTNALSITNEGLAATFTGTLTASKFIGTLNNTLTFSTGIFTAKTYNNSSAITVNIPTHTSHLVNNSGFLTLHLSLTNYVTLNTVLTITNYKIFRMNVPVDDRETVYYNIGLKLSSYGNNHKKVAAIGLGNEPSNWYKAAIGFERTNTYDRGDIVFLFNNKSDRTTCVYSDIKVRINANGNINTLGSISANGFIKTDSSDSYILLGGGGHKAIFDFMLKTDELSNNLTTISKSLTVTKDWMDTGIKNTDLPANGTYIIQVSANNTADSIRHNYWSGIMSWYKDGTDDSDSDEIILHRAGHAYGHTIYLRTIMTTSSDGRHLRLQIAADTNLSTAVTYTFKFKRVI